MKARVSYYLTAVSILAILTATLACSKAPTDAQIASEVQSRLNADSGLQGKQLEVQSASGTVTLSGTVDNDAQRDAAARYASGVTGVKQVVNNLQITPAAAAPVAQAQPEPAPTKQRPSPSKRRHHASRADDSFQPADQPVTQAASTPPPAPSPAAPPAQAPAAEPMAPPPPPPPPQKVTIPSGTALAVRLVDPIDSEKNQVGDVFHATLNTPLSVGGDIAIPAGCDVTGHLVDVKSAGKFAGQSVVVLQLDGITSGGKTYNLQSDQYKREGSSRGKNTAEKVGAGAGIGAIIGALAGGGKGAAIGAAAGGGLGGGVQAATKGQQIKLPSETVLNFTLQGSLTVVATDQGPNSRRQTVDNQ